MKRQAKKKQSVAATPPPTKSVFVKLEVDGTEKPKTLTLRVGSVEFDVDDTTDKNWVVSWINFLSKELSL